VRHSGTNEGAKGESEEEAGLPHAGGRESASLGSADKHVVIVVVFNLNNNQRLVLLQQHIQLGQGHLALSWG
jgi:hypothetical protein